VTRAAMALLVTGEDPESGDGRRLTQVVAALQQVKPCSPASSDINPSP